MSCDLVDLAWIAPKVGIENNYSDGEAANKFRPFFEVPAHQIAHNLTMIRRIN